MYRNYKSITIEFMFMVIFTSIMTFIATELDDFAVFVLLFARQKKCFLPVFLGQLLALISITMLCGFAAFFLEKIPAGYLRFLGVIPLVLGIIKIFHKEVDEEEESNSAHKSLFVTALLLTVSSSADNVGIYIPYFTGLSTAEKILSMTVFILLQSGWSFLQYRTANLEKVQVFVEKTARVLVPAVFILLGLSILIF